MTDAKVQEEPKAKLRFLHFSDIHFGQEKNGAWVHDDIRREVLNDCQKVLSDKYIEGVADAIIVTGDVAYAGKEPEFKRAVEWLDSLTSIAGCDRLAVHVIPGNHDVDVKVLGSAGASLQSELRKKSAEDVHAFFHKIVDEPDSPVLAKFKDYRSFAAAYGSDFKSFQQPITVKSYELAGGNGLRFIGLCSVLLSDLDEAPGNLILCESQYAIARDDHYEEIVLVHHPLNWFMDQQQASQYFNTRARVLITGHEHLPDLAVTTRGAWQQLRVAAGAMNPPAQSQLNPFTYNWLEFSWVAENGHKILEVGIFPRVWNPTETRFDPDYHRTDGVGFRKLQLDCGAIKDSQSQVKKSVETKTAADEVTDMPETNPVPSVVRDQAAFELLRFLFWRHLDRKTRGEVLVELKLLQGSPTGPLPSAFERQAFELATERGQLAELWEAVMRRIPENERKINPFKEGK